LWFIPVRNMLLKATFQHSFWWWFGATSAVNKKWLSSRSACHDFVSVKNTSLSQEYKIYSPPFEWTAPPHSPGKTLWQRQPKPDWCGLVFEKPSLIFDASTTICTRPNSRAAPLFPNLSCNLCPTLTAHSEVMPFSELAETRVQAINPYLIRVLGWTWPPALGSKYNPWEYIHLGCVALPAVLSKVRHRPETLYVPTEVHTLQVEGLPFFCFCFVLSPHS